MSSLALLQSLRESIQGQATVKTVYGEPIEAQGKTIIPVAKIAFGFGAGKALAVLKIPLLGPKEEVEAEVHEPSQ